jgi:hypothetical protein
MKIALYPFPHQPWLRLFWHIMKRGYRRDTRWLRRKRREWWPTWESLSVEQRVKALMLTPMPKRGKS